MSGLRDKCEQSKIDFICEFMPDLDLFDPRRFEEGMFRHGLPTVYQMTRMFDDLQAECWASFLAKLEARFPALDEEYRELLKGFWEDGQLFENTRIGGKLIDGQRIYRKVSDPIYAHDSIMAWD